MAHNLTGKQFGHLTVLHKVENRFDGKNQWLCECECGNRKIYITNMLTGSKGAKTCRNCKDHVYRKNAYMSWQSARQRCRDINHKDYPRYGGKGILFSPVWDDFKIFYAELGDPPVDPTWNERYTLDRIDGTKGYEPGNCRWANRDTQGRNKSNVIF